MAMASSPPPTPSWAILRKVPDVVSANNRDGFSVSRASPPLLISRLTVYARRHAQSAARPRILATDLSAGLLLLTARPPAKAGYTVLDAADPTVSYSVPGRTGPDPASLGVISTPSGGGGPGPGFMVVGFESQFGHPEGEAWLHCYTPRSSRTGVWATKRVQNPRPRRTWAFDHVIARDGRLWWVDTTNIAGHLSCDPFAAHPSMAFARLPDNVSDAAHRSEDATDGLRGFCRHFCSGIPLAARRRVQVVDGKFRWVQMLCPHMLGSWGGAPTVVMRTLDDDPRAAQWRMVRGRHCLSFADVWASDSYKATELPEKEPAVAFIHPYNPAVVYFLLRRHLFGVDIFAKEVVAFQQQAMPEPDDVSAASSLLACRFQPPALTAAAPPSQSQVSSHQATGEASGNDGAKNTEEPEAKRAVYLKSHRQGVIC